MSRPIALWHTEHVNFAALLDLLEGQLDIFQRGGPPDYELMLDIMFYMTHYPDVLHHPKEDLAFAKIRAREVSARPIVDNLAEQHARLKADGNALVLALDDIVNGSIIAGHVQAPAERTSRLPQPHGSGGGDPPWRQAADARTGRRSTPRYCSWKIPFNSKRIAICGAPPADRAQAPPSRPAPHR
jgi:hypothetical protein